MLRHLSAFLLSTCLLAGVHAHAAPRYDLEDKKLAAMVNGEPVSREALALMWAIAQQSKPEATEAEVLFSIIEDRLIGEYALKRYTQAQLLNDNRVGFRPDVALRDQMVVNLRVVYAEAMDKAVAAMKGGRLQATVSASHAMTAADWERVLGPAGTMQLEYHLPAAREKTAASLALLQYRFDRDHSGSISFADVYEAQNVQGRNRLHQRDSAYVDEVAKRLLADRFVFYWAKNRSGLAAADYALLERAVRDRAYREGLTTQLGITADIHADSAHLKQLAATVTQEEVAAYYQSHRENFRRIERVKARHISLNDFETANKAYAELRQGKPFAEVARRYSVAADREQGGDLGWIVHAEKLPNWLQSVAFTQKPSVMSKPFRSPAAPDQAATWEILLVDEREEGYQPVESESVRYVAGQVIARQKAVAEFRAIREEVLQSADVRLNPAVVKPARGDAK